jgi:adenylosuccinate synthase
MVQADVIVDLQAGDCGKGKITSHLAPNYDGVLRYNGGGNAGHTIFVKGVKIVTHQVPCGVLHGKVSIIGPECVVNIDELIDETNMLESFGFNPKDLLYVDYRTHVITQTHLDEDGKDTRIGTTRKGIGPAYASKANRDGIRIEELVELPFRVGNVYDMFHTNPKSYFINEWGERIANPKILCEGAQGYQLDINFGRYPFVTSSHCTTGAVCLNGIPPQAIDRVFGIMKAYRTYVGNDESWCKSDDPALLKIQTAGNEVGATTGRKRKTDWLDLDEIIPACKVNGVTRIYINKVDVLEEVDKFGVYAGGLNYFSNSENFVKFVETYLRERHDIKDIIWSRSPSTV